jgi:hypothetical protein
MATYRAVWAFACFVPCLVGCFGGVHTPQPANNAPEDAPEPDLKPLLGAIEKLVVRHYPNAKVTLEDRTIRFEFNTRKFMIHEPTLTGEWQDAFEIVGPQKGGICGRLELRSGKYGGQLGLPHRSDKRYFTNQLMAPHSEKLNRHLKVELMYPADASEEFLKDFYRLVGEFDKYVRAGGK